MAPLTGPLSGPLALALERGREGFNAQFALARRARRRLDPEAFAEHLHVAVDPIVRAVHAADPSRSEQVVALLFRHSLELVGRDLAGPRAKGAGINRAWMELLPHLGGLLAQDPEPLIRSLSNAAFQLEAEPGLDLGTWFKAMREGAVLCPRPQDLLTLGQVLAWRLGLAHYRDSALALLPQLPEPVIRWVLSAGAEPLPQLMTSLADPWMLPGAKGKRGLSMLHRPGGFVGFGGPFSTPPRVMVVEGKLYAFDEQCVWSLFADRFGATLRRYGPELPDGQEGGPQRGAVSPDGTARLGDYSRKFPELSGCSSAASDGWTLAVTLPHSHRITLVALTSEGV